MVTNKNSSESNIFEELFRFWEGEMCFSLERCCNLKKPCLKRETETRFFDNRLKRERCRKNKKAVKSLQSERLNRREGSVAAVSCAFFGPNLWPEWSFFRTRARFLTQKHENVNITRDQAPLARKRRCGRYGVKLFLFLQPLQRFSSLFASKPPFGGPELQYFARRPKLHSWY